MKTPQAEFEPERSITITLHLIEIMHLLDGLSRLAKEPHHFDLAAPDYRELATFLTERIRSIDSTNPMADGSWIIHPSRSPVHRPVREIHHHHYHPQRPRGPH